MGNQLTVDYQELHLQDVGQGIVWNRNLGNGRLFKSACCWQDGKYKVVKVFRKKDDVPNTVYQQIGKEVHHFYARLSIEKQPNVLPLERTVETNEAAYLIRQYLHSSLAERISTRPFPSPMCKRWIAFQILKGVSQLHEAGLYHGDIKAENVVLTGWDWVFLTDMAMFKPPTLPAGNPADFSYFFDTSPLRTCCIAPERFRDDSSSSMGQVIMDAMNEASQAQALATKSVSIAGADMRLLNNPLLQDDNSNVPSSEFPSLSSSLPAPSPAPAPAPSPSLLSSTMPSSGGTLTKRLFAKLQSNGEMFDDDALFLGSNDPDVVVTAKPPKTSTPQRVVTIIEDVRPNPNAIINKKITEAMDIFSAGCVIAQMFLDGDPAFDLARLLAYRNGDQEKFRTTLDNRVDDPDVRALILHMLQIDPQKRFSAAEYLQKWTGTVFPVYFDDLHKYILSGLLTLKSDEAIECINQIYDQLLQITRDDYTPHNKEAAAATTPENITPLREQQQQQQQAGGDTEWVKSDTRDGIEENWKAQLKLSQSISTPRYAMPPSLPNLLKDATAFLQKHRALKQAETLEDHGEEKEKDANNPQPDNKTSQTVEDPTPKTRSGSQPPSRPNAQIQPGMEIIATIVCANIRNAKSIAVRAHGLSLIHRLADCVPNSTLLEYLMPWCIAMLTDSAPLIRAMALRTLCHVLGRVTSVPASEAIVFNEYILPALTPLCTDSSTIVIATLAEHLAILAQESLRFLEMAQVARRESMKTSAAAVDDAFKGNFDADLGLLQDEFKEIVSSLVNCNEPSVNRALLSDFTRLCSFFGSNRTESFVYPIATTFLNSREWEVRHAFFESLTGVAMFMNAASVQKYILAIINEKISVSPDVEEFVIHQALKSLSSLCEDSMLPKNTVLEEATRVVPLLYHPNQWIRNEAIMFFVKASKQLGLADTNCSLKPILEPHLTQRNIMFIDENSLLETVKPPLPRALFSKALSVFSPANSITSEGPFNDSRAKWEEVLHATIPEEDVMKLALLESFLRNAARAIYIKSMWSDEPTPSSTPCHQMQHDIEVITLSQQFDVPVRTKLEHVAMTGGVPDEMLLPPGSRESIKVSTARTDTVKQNPEFSNEWNTLFKQPTARQLAASRTLRRNNTLKDLSTSPVLQPAASPPLSAKSSPSAGSVPVTYSIPVDKSPTTFMDLPHFRPSGHLIAQAHEHRGAINEVAVHDSMLWFATGGSDGTVRLWDVRTLERDSALVSSMVYSLPGYAGRSLSLAILQQTTNATIATSTSKGFIHLISADLGVPVGAIRITDTGHAEFLPPDYQPNSTITNGGAVYVVRQCISSCFASPILMCGTQNGEIIAIDPRAGKEAFVWKNTSRHASSSATQASINGASMGPISALYIGGSSGVDASNNVMDASASTWMVSGTKRGFLTTWDLRFQVPVASWKAIGSGSGGSSLGSIEYTESGSINNICAASSVHSSLFAFGGLGGAYDGFAEEAGSTAGSATTTNSGATIIGGGRKRAQSTVSIGGGSSPNSMNSFMGSNGGGSSSSDMISATAATAGHPAEPFVFVCGSGDLYNEVSLWNVATQKRVAVFRTALPTTTTSSVHHHNHHQTNNNNNNSAASAHGSNPSSPINASSSHWRFGSTPHWSATTTTTTTTAAALSTPSQSIHETRAMYVLPETGGILTGGTDRRIRYWDICRPSQSYVVCGSDPLEKKTRFAGSELAVGGGDSVLLIQEEIQGLARSNNNNNSSSSSRPAAIPPGANGNSNNDNDNDNQAHHDHVHHTTHHHYHHRGSTFSNYNNEVPLGHRDCITDLKLILVPSAPSPLDSASQRSGGVAGSSGGSGIREAQGGSVNAMGSLFPSPNSHLLTLVSTSRDGVIKLWR